YGRDPTMRAGLLWLQRQVRCGDYHDDHAALSSRPCRSGWPAWAAPALFLVQLPQVVTMPGGKQRPSGVEPVRMSCSLGSSPIPLTSSPSSSSAVSLLMLLFALCRWSTFSAMTTPLALRQGPRPIRSRAL